MTEFGITKENMFEFWDVSGINYMYVRMSVLSCSKDKT